MTVFVNYEVRVLKHDNGPDTYKAQAQHEGRVYGTVAGDRAEAVLGMKDEISKAFPEETVFVYAEHKPSAQKEPGDG